MQSHAAHPVALLTAQYTMLPVMIIQPGAFSVPGLEVVIALQITMSVQHTMHQATTRQFILIYQHQCNIVSALAS